MHVSDRKGAVSIEVEEGEIRFDGGVGVAGRMLEFYEVNYETAELLRDELTSIIEMRKKMIHAGLQIMTRTV